MIEWVEISNGGPSQRVAEAGGSPVLEAQGVGGSSPDNDGTVRYCQTGRVRQARREGVARANQWQNPLKRGIGSNLADVGRDAAHAGAGVGRRLRGWYFVAGAEAMRKDCGVLVARLQGKSWAPPPSIDRLVNVGTILGLPVMWRAGSLSAVGPGVGRSLRSSPSRGKPGTWRREAADLQRQTGTRGGRC
jgi:hypothetical protein